MKLTMILWNRFPIKHGIARRCGAVTDQYPIDKQDKIRCRKNYAATAQQIVAALGGVDNVVAVTHCMTRLRFVVKDNEQVDSPTLKGLTGVLGVVRSDNQCRDHRQHGLTGLSRGGESAARRPAPGRAAGQSAGHPETHRRRDPDALIGTMSPLIPAIIGGSMVKLLAMILR